MYMKIFLGNIILSWRSRMTYPSAFILTIICQLFGYFTQIFTTWILINNFKSLNGWSVYEITYLYSIQLLTYSLAASIAANTVVELPKLVRDGGFNEILIKPINSLFYLMSTNYNVGYIAHFTIALSTMIISLIGAQVNLTIMSFALLVGGIVCGTIITICIMLIVTFPCIYWIGSSGFWNIFYNLRMFNNYPLTIFNKLVQSIFTFVIPFAFATYLQANVLFNKNDALLSNFAVIILTPIVTVTLVGLTVFMWNYALKKYEGSGS